MIDKPIDQVTEADLQFLIDNSIVEQKRLEYKSELPSDQLSDKIKFLACVSSFSNTIGGTIIYGIKENEKHIPTSLEGLDIDDVDKVILRLDQIIRAGISPRPPYIGIQPLRLSSGRHALLVRVEKSWASPHMVSLNEHYKFYMRSSNGRYAMDVDELRDAFGRAEALTIRIKRFVQERHSQIYSDEAPMRLEEGLKLVCHFVPFSFADSAAFVAFMNEDEMRDKLRPLSTIRWDGHFNFEGFCAHSSGENGVFRSYSQFFRNGVIETVVRIGNDKKSLDPLLVEDLVLMFAERYLPLLKEFSVSTPLALYVSLLGAKGYIRTREWGFFVSDSSRPIMKEEVLLPVAQIDDYEQDVKAVLKPTFDTLCNTLGLQRSLSYDKDGKWTRNP